MGARKYAGITTDPDRRKQQHKQEDYPNLSNWQVQRTFSNQQEAQRWENEMGKRGYTTHPGGRPDSGTWYGYTFDY